jgi:oxygen-independent coproporphyrinogen-3 oxidase
MTAIGLYLHIPFCRQKCAYCDFSSYAGRESLVAPYLDALDREMALWHDHLGCGAQARTLYVGGGTPTVLPAAGLASLVERARRAFALPEEAEITVEANPGTVNSAYFRCLRRAGANRLSLGVQSYDDRLLALLGRIHNADQADASVRDARAAGFQNLNLDLMLGLPRQTLGDWQASVRRALDLAPQHLSLYALTVEQGTPLAAQIERGALPAPDDDLAAEMYEWAAGALARAGYDHYEISNWALPGYACRHNLVYWRNEPYLGLGAGAHSWFGGWRRANLRDPGAYIRALGDQRSPARGDAAPVRGGAATMAQFPAAYRMSCNLCRGEACLAGTANLHHSRHTTQLPVAEVLEIDRALEMAETMIMGLRLLDEGVSYARFERRFGLPMEQVYGAEIAAAVEEGLLERVSERAPSGVQTRVRLTGRGALLGNRVFVRFVGEGG